ncbi:hypothetical protein [Pseudohaliea rubra]|uniref:Uncharacterized protein n=1 Tax=Pseudohaliea rubra DSM 19751 TaxID=1265313 RepID=A0A095X0T0_9GAMM|nr:hypothetical protein [Pseudohaliea rubra]KGE04504.1 hypothetical protein HRUBRA_00843 [Pseudohaliea rubra DSM 19751]
MSSAEPKLKRRAKGKRPFYFSDPDIDRLLSMLMALAGELSVTRDRLDTLERVAQAKGLLSQADIEAFELDEQALSDRAARHQVLFKEVTRIISAELEGLDDSDATEYAEVVAQVERDD